MQITRTRWRRRARVEFSDRKGKGREHRQLIIKSDPTRIGLRTQIRLLYRLGNDVGLAASRTIRFLSRGRSFRDDSLIAMRTMEANLFVRRDDIGGDLNRATAHVTDD